MSLNHYVNNIYALQFLGVGCSLLTDDFKINVGFQKVGKQ